MKAKVLRFRLMQCGIDSWVFWLLNPFEMWILTWVRDRSSVLHVLVYGYERTRRCFANLLKKTAVSRTSSRGQRREKVESIYLGQLLSSSTLIVSRIYLLQHMRVFGTLFVHLYWSLRIVITLHIFSSRSLHFFSFLGIFISTMTFYVFQCIVKQ